MITTQYQSLFKEDKRDYIAHLRGATQVIHTGENLLIYFPSTLLGDYAASWAWEYRGEFLKKVRFVKILVDEDVVGESVKKY